MYEDTTWRVAALCRGENAVHFFAPNHMERKEEKDHREAAARALCSRCPVREECLDYALTVGEPHGIWGGLNELQRSRLIRRRSA
jgi:WhiB family redox-sensing transcriptional regulator